MGTRIVIERHVDIFVKRTSYTTANACVWQQVDGIVEEEHIARHGSAKFDVVDGESIGQVARTMFLR